MTHPFCQYSAALGIAMAMAQPLLEVKHGETHRTGDHGTSRERRQGRSRTPNGRCRQWGETESGGTILRASHAYVEAEHEGLTSRMMPDACGPQKRWDDVRVACRRDAWLGGVNAGPWFASYSKCRTLAVASPGDQQHVTMRSKEVHDHDPDDS